MKRLFCLIASTALMFSFCITTNAAGSSSLSGNSSVTVGNNIEFTVNVSGCGDATSIAVAITHSGNFEFVSGSWLKSGSITKFDVATKKGALGGLASPDVNGNLFKVVLKAKTASANAQSISVNVIAKNGSTEIMNVTPTKSVKINCATHSYGGYTNANASSHTRTCSACGNVETTGHRWDGGTQTKPASCKETGNKLYTCLDCGATKNETIAKTNNHTFGGWSQTSAPSCTGKGSESHTCSTCQKVESRDIKATGHSTGGWTTTKEAKCTTAGEQTRSCSKCSHKETKSIAALGHSFSNPTITKQPTCTETGIESGKCTRCNQQTTNTIRATGHKMTSFTVTLEPTCTTEGTKAGTCSVCGASAQEAIPATGHTFGEAVVTKEATETETGVKTATCTVCGETQEEEIPYLSEVIPEDEETDTPNDMEEPAHDKKGNTAWIWIVVGVAVVGVAAIVVYIILKDKKKTKE